MDEDSYWGCEIKKERMRKMLLCEFLTSHGVGWFKVLQKRKNSKPVRDTSTRDGPLNRRQSHIYKGPPIYFGDRRQ